MKLNRTPARALTVNSHLRWVATEANDVPLDPFESLDLVQEASVQIPVGRVIESGRGEEAEGG